jgi:acyl-CoA thioesterase-1
LTVIIIVLGCLLGGCKRQSETAPVSAKGPPAYAGTIVAVGDSLTAGYGVAEAEAYPPRLEQQLRDAGCNWRVINAGISGETSSGTLSRIGWVLKLRPDIVILETGANDGLRGIDPRLTRKNLDETVRILKENQVIVVLAGMRMVSNLGRDYTDAFAAIYPAVAKRHSLMLIPFFLSGVAGEPSLNQADGVHPNAEGYRIVTVTLYPYALRAVAEKQRTRRQR